MLVLTRKAKDGGIVLFNRETGEFIAKVEVTKIGGAVVSVGVTAPKSVGVMRGELLNQPLVDVPNTPVIPGAAVA